MLAGCLLTPRRLTSFLDRYNRMAIGLVLTAYNELAGNNNIVKGKQRQRRCRKYMYNRWVAKLRAENGEEILDNSPQLGILTVCVG